MKRGSDPLKVQQWTRRLKRFRSSGMTVARFCRSEGVSQPSFYQWKRKLAAQDAAGERPVPKTGRQARSATRKQRTGGAASGSFQTVRLMGTAGHDPQLTTDRDRCVTVRIPGGIELAFTDNLPMVEMVVDKLLQTLPGKALPAKTGERSC